MFIFILIASLRLPVELEINMSAIFKSAIIPSVALFLVFCIKAILSFRKEIKKKLSDLLFPVLALLPIWIACVFVIGFITCFLDVINYYIPTNNENYVKKVIVNDLVYSKQNSVYFIPEDSFENDVYIIGVNNEEFKNYEIGEKYNMILKDGALGFPICEGFEKVE